MQESLKIIHQAMENMPAGPVNVGPARGPSCRRRARSGRRIEGLISHFELVMTNRGFQVPSEEVYAATEAPNGELGFYIVGDGTPTGLSGPLPAAVVHPFRHVSPLDSRPHAQRHRGRAGQLEHHCRGVGPVSENLQDVAERAPAGRRC